MKVWVTRAQPGADRTAARLTASGHQPLVAPLLALEPLLGADLDLAGVSALAFTSANGVHAFAAAQREGRRLPVYAVGDATAEAAEAAGFLQVRSAGGDVGALARLIAAEAPGGLVLHPAPREPAGDLGGDLAANGVRVRHAALYEARTLPASPATAAAWPDIEAVLVHSPRGGETLAAALEGRPPPSFFAACISEAAAEPLRGRLAEIRVAARPEEGALLALLGKPVGPS